VVSDYPHHDAEDGWEALELMARHKVPVAVQRKLLGENARRLYGIDPSWWSRARRAVRAGQAALVA